MKLLRVLILLFFAVSISSSASDIDSLKTMLSVSMYDSGRVDLYINLARAYMNSDPQQAISYANMAKELAEKFHYKRGIALSYKTLGIGYFNKGKYLDALHNYELSMATFDSIGDRKGVANILSNMGNIYTQKGDDDRAIELYFKSRKISEEVNDTLRILTTLSNIGVVYMNKPGTYDKALEFLHLALPLSLAINDNNSTGPILVNIGEVYFKKYNPANLKTKDYLDSAIMYYNQSLAVSIGTDNEPYTLNNMGMAFLKKGDFEKAINYHRQAYSKAMKLDLKYDMGIAKQGIGDVYLAKKDFKAALIAFKEAEVLAKETSSNYVLKDIYSGLATVFTRLKDFGNAIEYQNLLIAIKDSIYNIEAEKKLGSIQFNFDLNKKQSEISLLTKDQELKEKEISRQKIVRNSFVGGFIIVLLFAGVFFKQRNRISKEKKRSDELLLNILPAETAEELKATGTAQAKSFDLVTVLFTDFKNFTQASEKLSAVELVQEINNCYSEFDRIITRHGIEKIKTIGDSYMCAGGIPVANTTHPVDVVSAGLEMVAFIEKNKQERIAKGIPYFELRCGIHTGHVVAGIVGIKKFAYDIWGDTVNTASRMESSGAVGKVNVSGTTFELIRDKFTCTHRGKIEAKNKGTIDMYFVEGHS